MPETGVKIGMSGHRRRVGADWDWVRRAIDHHIVSLPHVTGLTSLATGADQVFANTVLARGGSLVAVVPCCDGEPKVEAGNENNFEQFRSQATSVICVEAGGPDEAYLQAGRLVVDLSDQMLFVWDGGPARGAGGTADIVAYAASIRKPGIILDPILKTARRL